MKFAINRYSLNYHIVKDDPLPIANLKIEHLAFGVPPFELREIWTMDISDLGELLELVMNLGISAEVSYSPFWSNNELHNPGNRLFGISLIDNPDHLVDPRDRPVLIVSK